MATIEVCVPDIGDFTDVAVIELLVKPGDTVRAEQSLVTVESDKASMEIPSSQAGVVKEMKIKLGDTVSQGSVILTLEAADSMPFAQPAKKPATAKTVAAKKPATKSAAAKPAVKKAAPAKKPAAAKTVAAKKPAAKSAAAKPAVKKAAAPKKAAAAAAPSTPWKQPSAQTQLSPQAAWPFPSGSRP